MPNRLEKKAISTYVPGTPAVAYQPAYCIPNSGVASVGLGGSSYTGGSSERMMGVDSANEVYYGLWLWDNTNISSRPV